MLTYLIKQSLASIFLAASASVMPATSTPAVTPAPVTHVEECTNKACITELITAYAKVYGVDPDFALAIAKCESELKTTAVGDGGRARGVFQFHKPTFEMFAKKMGQPDLDYKNTEDNVNVAMWAFAHDKQSHWSCTEKIALN